MSKNLDKEHKTILLIDDDNDILESTRMVLEMSGHNVITASSGEVGIYLYKEHKPSLVLLDLNMPKTDGFETFSKLITYDKNAKVVLFTGSLIDENKLQRAHKNGLLDVILKPASLNELNNIIHKYIWVHYCILDTTTPLETNPNIVYNLTIINWNLNQNKLLNYNISIS